MTENEKAATFIGWKPDDCHCALKPGAHGHFCPDMSRPENYMRALTCGRMVSWGLKYDASRDGLICELRSARDAEIQVAGSSSHVVVLALAALYDQEHPNG